MVDNNSDRESIVVSIVERRGGKKKEEKNEVAGWQRLALAGLGRGGGRGGRILDFDPFLSFPLGNLHKLKRWADGDTHLL